MLKKKTRFYVCSDEIEKLKYITKVFGDKIINPFYENSLLPDRKSLEGQILAVVDLFCLGRTRYIIGTEQSTFSYEAYHLACAYFEGKSEVTIEFVHNRGPQSRFGNQNIFPIKI